MSNTNLDTIDSLLHQNTYLDNGKLVNWDGKMDEVHSTISTSSEYKPTLLGTVPHMDEPTALKVLNSAVKAYDKGKGQWPTMRVKR